MRFLPDYSAHAFHTQAAKQHAEVWRLLLGIVAMVVIYFLLGAMYQQVVVGLIQYRPSFEGELIAGDTPLAMYVLLFSFAVATLSIFVVVTFLHKRDALTVLGPLMLAVPQFFRVLAMLVVLALVLMVLPPYGMGGPLTPNLGLGLWIILLPLSLVAVFIQISAEEVFFRGYLQQQLGARFKSPLIWMGIPTFLFALGHYQPSDAGSNAVMIVVWAGVFGLLMADLTARSGSIGPAIAVHLVNNVTALLVVALPDALGGLALWHTSFGMENVEELRAWLPVDFAMIIVSWLAARLALRR